MKVIGRGPLHVARLQSRDLEAGILDEGLNRPIKVASTGDPLPKRR